MFPPVFFRRTLRDQPTHSNTPTNPHSLLFFSFRDGFQYFSSASFTFPQVLLRRLRSPRTLLPGCCWFFVGIVISVYLYADTHTNTHSPIPVINQRFRLFRWENNYNTKSFLYRGLIREKKSLPLRKIDNATKYNENDHRYEVKLVLQRNITKNIVSIR